MQGVIRFFRGSISLVVTGAFPERFLNLCAQHGVLFRNLTWHDAHTLGIEVARHQFQRVKEVAARVCCEVEVQRHAGVPHQLEKLRHRYAFWVGMTLAIATVLILSQFILTVEVTGNEQVPTAVILAELSRQGVKVGAYGPHIEERVASQEALIHLPELTWMTVNLHGTRAEVIVRERVEKPEIVDLTTPAHIVAETTGLITRIEPRSGQPLFEVGEMV